MAYSQSPQPFSDDVQAKLIHKILLDPGIPRANPTIPTWQLPPHPLSNAQSTELPKFTDFAIIGSGVTGCAVAKTLLESPVSGQRSVTVFEARTLCSGASSRNAGFLKSHIPTSFSHFVQEHGKAEALIFDQFMTRTSQKMRDLVSAQESDKDYTSEMRDVQCISAYQDREILRAANSSIKQYGECFPERKGQFSFLDSETLEKVHGLKDFVGGISSSAAVLWPYRLITRVFEKLLNTYEKRFTIETTTAVVSVNYSSETNSQYPYVLSTSRGDIRASHIFHCSNAFAGHLLPGLRGKIFATRHTNSCQSRGPSFPNVGSEHCWLFPSAANYDPASGIYEGGLYYMQQNAKTGDLFFGGQRDQLTEFISADDRKVSPISAGDLSSKLPTFFDHGWVDPATGTTKKPSVQYLWSGIIGSTPDHNPLVGRVPTSVTGRGGDHGGEWIAAGYNGYGMVQCFSSGEAIAQMALGQARPSWLPKALAITEERLSDEKRMGVKTALHSLVAAKWAAGGPTTERPKL